MCIKELISAAYEAQCNGATDVIISDDYKTLQFVKYDTVDSVNL